MFEDLDLTWYLIFNGMAFANDKDSYGATVLHAACASGRIEMVQKLLELGCRKDIVDKSGKLPADYAADLGYWDIVFFINES